MASPSSPSLALSSSVENAFPAVLSRAASLTDSSTDDMVQAITNAVNNVQPQEEHIHVAQNIDVEIDFGSWDDDIANELRSTNLNPNGPSGAPSQLGQPCVAPQPAMVPPLPLGSTKPWRSQSQASRRSRDDADSDGGVTPRRRRIERDASHPSWSRVDIDSLTSGSRDILVTRP